nr:hypothetical protein [Tanacetum cinerariifolium]
MRQSRWIELFSDYECEIHYHPGKANVVADALSRKLRARRSSKRTYLQKGGVRTIIIDEAQKTRYSVHPEADKMYHDLQLMYWWPGMKRDIATYSAKQSIFATSSVEVEYITAFDASNEAVWVRKFISGLSVVPTIEEPISMYCDNTREIAIANESGITKGARHFRAKVHYLREVIEFGDIKLEKVHTYDNLADPFTKPLAFSKHSEHTRNIGMLPASSLIWPSNVTLGRLLPRARGLGFKPRRGGFPSGAKKKWGLSPKAKVRVLHTAQLDVTGITIYTGIALLACCLWVVTIEVVGLFGEWWSGLMKVVGQQEWVVGGDGKTWAMNSRFDFGDRVESLGLVQNWSLELKELLHFQSLLVKCFRNWQV